MQSRVGHASDLWSLGVIIWQIHSKQNKTPFLAETQESTFQRIVAGDYQMPEGENVGPEAKDLISKLLVQDPTDRIGSQDI